MKTSGRHLHVGPKVGAAIGSASGPTGPTVPGKPTAVSATAGDTEAEVSFTAPANDGGDAITGYRVTSTPGSITATGSSSPITITGLTNGVEYTFTVAATNSIGYGAESDPSNAVTPVGAFAVIEEEVAEGGNPTNSVTFSATPSDGELLIAAVGCSVGTAAAALPSGFTQIVTEGDANKLVRIGYKVASSEAGATYSSTVNSTNSGLYMVRLTGGAAGVSGTNSDSGTSNAAASSGLTVPTDAFVVAAWILNNTSGGADAVDNSFTLKINASVNRFAAAARKYTTGGSSQNVNYSHTDSRSSRAALAVINPPS